MTVILRGQRTRLPFRAVAAVLAAFAAVLLTLGFSGGGTEFAGAQAPYGPSAHEPDTRPYGDDAYVGSRAPHTRPERDAGERTVLAGHPLFTAADTPQIPPRPARPAPAAGHAAPAAAHTPSDLGRAPPTASST
ncbi:hypothetical protein SHKM778_55740 [Streptomyces sp. KM77-8]|uniref:CAP domain-containing protein n=1 Tax=Streptomyces haneummycinicus TaxID=3074435 RepID=A0AAT9HNY9_9ACTN